MKSNIPILIHNINCLIPSLKKWTFISDTPCINTYNIHALRDRFAKIRIEFHVQPKHNSALSSVHFELSHGITFTSAMHIVWYL